MRLVILVAGATLLSGCSYEPLAAYADVRDQVQAATGIPLFGRGPCFRAMHDDKFESKKSLTEICFALTPPQRWHGLWRNDFEGSRFCVAPAASCANDTPGDWVWLGYSFGLQPGVAPGGLYEVDFIGRKTTVRGHYGHMGGSDYEMIADRMFSMRQIEAPPPEPTKAQMIKYWKACEAASSCIPNWEVINAIEE